MPMQMALMPKPCAAMLQGDPVWLRSRIRPLAGFACSQKYRNAVRCSESSSASVVRLRAFAAVAVRDAPGPPLNQTVVARSRRMGVAIVGCLAHEVVLRR